MCCWLACVGEWQHGFDQSLAEGGSMTAGESQAAKRAAANRLLLRHSSLTGTTERLGPAREKLAKLTRSLRLSLEAAVSPQRAAQP
mmetsp:Transcript_3505/g.8722  ORF Transcript_3505/g.8722 Transcript_3505/m.8722 type:complete len:86 (+) Transcript_3505:245-502(+)